MTRVWWLWWLPWLLLVRATDTFDPTLTCWLRARRPHDYPDWSYAAALVELAEDDVDAVRRGVPVRYPPDPYIQAHWAYLWRHRVPGRRFRGGALCAWMYLVDQRLQAAPTGDRNPRRHWHLADWQRPHVWWTPPAAAIETRTHQWQVYLGRHGARVACADPTPVPTSPPPLTVPPTRPPTPVPTRAPTPAPTRTPTVCRPHPRHADEETCQGPDAVDTARSAPYTVLRCGPTARRCRCASSQCQCACVAW